MEAPAMHLFDRMVSTISRYSMFGPGARIGVAVSGGADSVCLAHLMAELAPQWNLTLALLHLNHCLRGAESHADEQFVITLADRLGYPCHLERRSVATMPGNLEQAGRCARLEFFRAFLPDRLDCVATAHTQSDQAETVLYRMLRGSYNTGLAGIRPVTPDHIVRPMLWVTRSEVEEYLRKHALPWREDASNRDLSFDRNRIRHVFLPSLIADWNPQLPQILARHAELAREDEEYWEAEVEKAIPGRLILRKAEAIATLPSRDRKGAYSLSPSLQRRLIRRAIAHIRGNLREIDFRHIDEVVNLCRPDVGGHARIQVPGVDIMRSFDWVRFAPPGTVPRPDFSIPLEIPGVADLPGGGRLELHATTVHPTSISDSRDTLNEGLDGTLVRGLDTALRVRNWLPGDRFCRAGHSHQQKLKELFHEFRVPLWERRSWPVLVAGDRILWARRFGVAAELAASSSGRDIIQVRDTEP
jgi:tRNA(Ile)-lysidine synthase